MTRSELKDLLASCSLPPEEAMRRLEYSGFSFTDSPTRAVNVFQPGGFPTDGVTFGRDPKEADYVIPSLGVSRLHAKLETSNFHYTLRDLSSSNGTFINGTRCVPGRTYEVLAYDEISFGTPGSADAVTWIFVPVQQHQKTIENPYLVDWQKWGLKELNEEQARLPNSGQKFRDVLEAKLARHREELAANGTLKSTLEAFQGHRHTIDLPKTKELEVLLNKVLQGEVGYPGEVVIGRTVAPSKSALALQLPEELSTVSRQHLTLTYEPSSDSWSITDHSSNGTRVDGRRVPRFAEPIPTGAVITLGSDISLRFFPRSTPPLGSQDTIIIEGGKAYSIHSRGLYGRFIPPEDVLEILAETPSKFARHVKPLKVEQLVGRSSSALPSGSYIIYFPHHQLPVTLHRDDETGRVSLVTQQQAQRSCVHTCAFMLVADAFINSKRAEDGEILTSLASHVFLGTLAKVENEIGLNHPLRGTSFKVILRPIKEYVEPEVLAKHLALGPMMAAGRGEIGGHAFMVDGIDLAREVITIRDPWHGVKETIPFELFAGMCGIDDESVDSFVQLVPK